MYVYRPIPYILNSRPIIGDRVVYEAIKKLPFIDPTLLVLLELVLLGAYFKLGHRAIGLTAHNQIRILDDPDSSDGIAELNSHDPTADEAKLAFCHV